MTPVRAIYENGVFRPLDPVDLPKGTRVQICILKAVAPRTAQDEIHRILDERFESGHTDTAARHNDHQP